MSRRNNIRVAINIPILKRDIVVIMITIKSGIVFSISILAPKYKLKNITIRNSKLDLPICSKKLLKVP